jgi:hypothetical protein
MNDDGCELRPFRDEKGRCVRCGDPLEGIRRRWCSEDCYELDLDQHLWAAARYEVLRRDGKKCVKCGSPDRLEVNHVDPRIGRGYNVGCHNHHAGLETLCKTCHSAVTAEQIASRKRDPACSCNIAGPGPDNSWPDGPPHMDSGCPRHGQLDAGTDPNNTEMSQQ